MGGTVPGHVLIHAGLLSVAGTCFASLQYQAGLPSASPCLHFFLLMLNESITEVDICAAAAPGLEGSGVRTLCIEPEVLRSCSTWLCPQKNKFCPHASRGGAEVKLDDSSQICTATVSAAEL